ncbi:MAG: hypothetical protein ACM3YE_14535 [Bacteroidota bacterium]
MREIFTNDLGEIKIGETILPGIYQSMEISGKLRFDESQMQGKSGTSKQPLGYEDAVINVSLILTTDDNFTCYDRLKVIIAVFYKVNKTGKPYVYKIVNHLTSVWGIREVLFTDIRVRDDNKKDYLVIDIVFQEYLPTIVKRELKAVPPGDLDPYTDFTKIEETSATLSTKADIESPAKDDDQP